ncbi:MAG: tetratricopeptide repeat protein [Armatimonadetes bacterium]|nr:tetratricopeptide repeat protein [Armatimonadota bacterium]
MNVQEAYDRGFALRCEGRYGEAKLAFQQVLQQDPGHIQSRWQMALIQGFEGDFDGSLEALRQLSLQVPTNLDVLNDLAMTYNMLGYPDEACAAFKAILAINPDHENALRQIRYC